MHLPISLHGARMACFSAWSWGAMPKFYAGILKKFALAILLYKPVQWAQIAMVSFQKKKNSEKAKEITCYHSNR